MSEQKKKTNNEREKKTEREGQQTQPQDHTKLICKLNVSPNQYSDYRFLPSSLSFLLSKNEIRTLLDYLLQNFNLIYKKYRTLK